MIYLYAFLLLATFAAGVAVGWTNRSPETRTVEVEKVVEKIVRGEERVRVEFRDRIVTRTVIQKPDGTLITKDREKTTDKETSRETEITEKTEGRKSSTGVSKVRPGGGFAASRFSLGLKYWPRYSDLINDTRRFNWERAELSGGVRLLGPVWFDLGLRHNEVGFGIHWEF